MKRIILLCAIFAFGAFGLTAQTYRNPVIGGFHPDPSVVRVGDSFYLVNSSFEYFPGVPIYRSDNLVDWQLIGNVLDRESQLPLQGASSWLGIYAPTIRYNDGVWYMITTNVGNGGNFMVTASNPEGPWSDPIWLSQQGIDPSLYFEDGHCYMVSNPDGNITLCEIDAKTGQQLTPSQTLWRGTGGRYPEGPHIYNKDGYYYLLISEGGTELAHKLTIARSRNIYGPYESNPANPIMTNCRMEGEGMQIQGTGHGDLVQAQDGSWWITFLAYRNFGGSYHHLGRETNLAPVEWQAGEWPVVYEGKPIDTLMTPKHLIKPSVSKPSQERIYRFADMAKANESLSHEWIYIQNPDSSNYELTSKGLILHGKQSLTVNNRPTFVGQRQENAVATVTADLTTEQLAAGSEAGLTVYQIADGHLDLFARKNNEAQAEVVLRYQVKSICHEEKSIAIPCDAVRLIISSDGTSYHFFAQYANDKQSPATNLVELGQVETLLMSTEVVGGFTGVTIGMYAAGEGSACFSQFSYAQDKAPVR